MAIVGTPLYQASIGTDLSLYSFPDVTWNAYDVLLISISSRVGTGLTADPPIAMSLGGFVAARIDNDQWTAAGTRNASIWLVIPTAAGPGILTVSMAIAHLECNVIIDRVLGTGIPVAYSGANVYSASTSGATTITATLPLALTNAQSAHYCVVVHQNEETTTAGAGFTKITDFSSTAGNQTQLCSMLKLNDLTCDPSWATAGACAIISVELKAATAQAISEAATLAEAVVVTKGAIIAETVTLSEAAELVVDKALAEGLALVDLVAVITFLGAVADESLALSEAVGFVFGLAVTGSFTLSDTVLIVGAMPPDAQARWAPRWLVEIDW